MISIWHCLATDLHHCHGAIIVLQSCWWEEKSRQTYPRQPASWLLMHFLSDFKQKDKDFKEKQKKNYDHKHRAWPLDILPDNTPVWVRIGNNQTPGRVMSNASTPRSYNIVSTPCGKCAETDKTLVIDWTQQMTMLQTFLMLLQQQYHLILLSLKEIKSWPGLKLVSTLDLQ